MYNIFHLLLNKGFFIALIFFISIVGLIVPYGFPIFSLIIIVYFIIYLISNRIKLSRKLGLLEFLFFISIAIYMSSLLQNGGLLYSQNISEIVNILTVILVYLIINNIGTKEYSTFIYSLSIMIAIFLPAISIFSLYKYFLLTQGIQLDFLVLEGRSYPWGTTLMPDYNMFALGMLISIVFISRILLNSRNILINIYCLLGILSMFATVLLSGSRRGLVVIPIIIVFFSFIIIKKLLKRRQQFRNFILFSLTAIVLLITASQLPYSSVTQSYEFEKIVNRFSTLSNTSNSFSQRSERWSYGFTMIEQSDIVDIFIGNGFSYLESYAKEFNVESGEEYPHNPLISTFHYSGITGVIVLVALIFLVGISQLINYKIFGFELIISFILSILFLFISANSIFTTKFLLLLICLIVVIDKKIRKQGCFYEKSIVYSASKL